ncbi:MAG: hypothetical protein U0172_12265 [Nitrospiraceae bacterium]
MMRRLCALACACLVSVPMAGWAAKFPEPTVDYSADTSMEMESHQMKGHVYYSPGKIRQEMGGKDGMAAIVRLDKKLVWSLMGDTYMEMAINERDENDIRNMDIEMTPMGEEAVNGIKTTKSKVIATTKDGKKFGGFFWTTKENITVKMDLLMKEGEQKHRMLSELANLKIEKQNPALFEPPPGATKTDMGAMMGGMMGGQGRGRGPAPGGPGAGARPNIDEMMKGMKGGDGGIDIEKLKEMMGR